MSGNWMRTVKSAGLVAVMTAGLLGGVAAAPSVAVSHECDRAIDMYPEDKTYAMWMPFQWEPLYQADCLVHKGAVGSEVRAIQRALNRCHGRSLEVDGVFGDKTFTALKNVQSRLGLVADGVYGPKTRDAMSWPRFRESTAQFVNCVK
ncbi:hypothetical protein GCM10027028_44470 [Streptomyces sundarbansensis]